VLNIFSVYYLYLVYMLWSVGLLFHVYVVVLSPFVWCHGSLLDLYRVRPKYLIRLISIFSATTWNFNAKFHVLITVNTSKNRPNGIWYSLTVAKVGLLIFLQDNGVILHIQKPCNELRVLKANESCCLWRKSDVNFINKVCKVFSLNFWSYLS